MKRRDLIKKLDAAGFELKRNGSDHDAYERQPWEIEEIPRHKEIKENLAKGILKTWGIK